MDSLIFAKEAFLLAEGDIVGGLKQSKYELDIEAYRSFERIGLLRLHTARDRERLAGFITILVTRHPHQVAQTWAHVDLLWIDPRYRTRDDFEAEPGRLGLRLLMSAEEALAAEGLASIRALVTRSERDSFLSLNYRPAETIYEKRIS